MEAGPVLDLHLDVGEGPTWDPETRSLMFVDVTPGRIHRFTPDTGRLDIVEFGQPVGAAIPVDRERTVVAARDGIYLADPSAGHPILIADIESENPGNRMNDAKVDPAGRLWAGTMAFDFAEGAAALYRVSGGSWERVLSDLTIANGLDWSPDGTLMYFIDSPTYRIDLFDFDATNGVPSDRRTFIEGEAADGMPDGMTVDADGGVWIAYFGAGEVRHFDPQGSHLDTVTVPASQVTSCCFGGDAMDTLYITSAAYELTEEQRRREPLAGAVFSCIPGVIGTPSTRFEVEDR
jgi:sugar lactone lactonase YvrE